MHIPDGYLSPSTCLCLYGAAAPFWYVALRRMRQAARTQLVPLLSVFAAFSFVVMMFNLPLPGGTTGHAVGVGISSIVLGPWASMLAISIALVIQALFFGDGGITAIGANCFNMAIVGSIVAYGCYRLFARGSTLRSGRRTAAAALAGYAAINSSALLAAIEFGIQPLFFRDASGAPLYAPYPLSVSIPAMMIGHLTLAGLAELILAGGVVAYFQRSQIELLRLTAPDAPDGDRAVPATARQFDLRRLWVGLALLLVLTPLGLLAVGSAWGEWSAQELATQSPLQHAPSGLERLSTVWTAPLPRYAPGVIRSAAFGYVLSAMVGVGLIIGVGLLLRKLPSRRTLRRGFLERTIGSLFRATERSLVAEELANKDGLLQRLDARTKLVGLLSLIVAATAVHRLSILLAIFALAVGLSAASRVPIATLALRVWLTAFTFSGAVAIPALFLTPGETLWSVPGLAWVVTSQGLRTAAFLIGRVETTATLASLLILCTPWARVLRALRFCRVPAIAVVMLGMTYRYIFLFLKTAHDMFESRRSRTFGDLPGPERRRLASASVGVLLSKSFQLSADVHTAMIARGFQGEVFFLEDTELRSTDWTMLLIFLALALAAVLLGR